MPIGDDRTENTFRNSVLFVNSMKSPIHFSVRCAWALLIVSGAVASAEDAVSFRRQVQPILSDKCFHCHGPDAENQDSAFRANTRENLFADLGDYFAVVPGSLEKSELHQRIHSTDPNDQMPPPDSNRTLTEAERKVLDLWILQGAPYERHWSFSKVERPAVPTIDGVQLSPTANPIDAFIAKRLREAGLTASPAADAETLLRRASLTLTGMLPPADLQKRFLKNPTSEAYEQAVNELLESMAYAERQSLRWMDAARYADTDGYQNDSERTNWPWRDWVTKAFHDNMPFDEFTIQQIAGDMLPDATWSQKLASAFNRNHRQNAEGGALADEFFIENVIDRVETTSTVWLGLTFGCARCHDHKYDPLSQREFYQLFAYFNNIGEKGIGRGVQANPTLKIVSPLADFSEQLLVDLETAEQQQQIAASTLPQRMNAWLAELTPVEDSTVWSPTNIKDFDLTGGGQLTRVDPETVRYSGGSSSPVTYRVAVDLPQPQEVQAIRVEALPDAAFGAPRQLAPSVNGNFVLTDARLTLNGEPVFVSTVTASFAQDNYPVTNIIDDNPSSGWAVFGPGVTGESVTATMLLDKRITLKATDQLELHLTFNNQYANHSMGMFRVQMTDAVNDQVLRSDGLSDAVAAAAQKPANKRSKDEQKKLRSYYESIDEPLIQARSNLRAAEAALTARSGPRATVMIMGERSGDPTPAYLLQRGQYDAPDQSEVLPRAVPKALLLDSDTEQPQDRLELGRWLVSRDNPLTARVFVNRIWQDHFGVGLVKTAEDFGLQGEVPSHPELLDWLAAEFMESGWDIKAMHRLIVTSATFRQSSRTTASLQATDPENRLLARGPRYRADGFTVRDIALQASGLLNAVPGGASVKPYQPAGLWSSMASGAGQKYGQSKGSDLYRKSMYTYWKRAVNPPRQTIFDAGGREVCNVRVRRTNTPLQALVLMNDPTMIEAARKLAERALQQPGSDATHQLTQMYRWSIGRNPNAKTLAVLDSNLRYFQSHFAENPKAAEQLLGVGESARDTNIPATEHAAMTATAHLIMNLDEFLTIE